MFHRINGELVNLADQLTGGQLRELLLEFRNIIIIIQKPNKNVYTNLLLSQIHRQCNGISC